MLITSVKDNEIETQMKEKRKTKTTKKRGGNYSERVRDK